MNIASDPDMIGNHWSEGQGFTTVDPETKETEFVNCEIQQGHLGKSAGNLHFTTGASTFCIVDISPAQFELLADFFNRAADMLRKCSN
jgi:hypothetical protein